MIKLRNKELLNKIAIKKNVDGFMFNNFTIDKTDFKTRADRLYYCRHCNKVYTEAANNGPIHDSNCSSEKVFKEHLFIDLIDEYIEDEIYKVYDDGTTITQIRYKNKLPTVIVNNLIINYKDKQVAVAKMIQKSKLKFNKRECIELNKESKKDKKYLYSFLLDITKRHKFFSENNICLAIEFTAYKNSFITIKELNSVLGSKAFKNNQYINDWLRIKDNDVGYSTRNLNAKNFILSCILNDKDLPSIEEIKKEYSIEEEELAFLLTTLNNSDTNIAIKESIFLYNLLFKSLKLMKYLKEKKIGNRNYFEILKYYTDINYTMNILTSIFKYNIIYDNYKEYVEYIDNYILQIVENEKKGFYIKYTIKDFIKKDIKDFNTFLIRNNIKNKKDFINSYNLKDSSYIDLALSIVDKDPLLYLSIINLSCNYENLKDVEDIYIIKNALDKIFGYNKKDKKFLDISQLKNDKYYSDIKNFIDSYKKRIDIMNKEYGEIINVNKLKDKIKETITINELKILYLTNEALKIKTNKNSFLSDSNIFKSLEIFLDKDVKISFYDFIKLIFQLKFIGFAKKTNTSTYKEEHLYYPELIYNQLDMIECYIAYAKFKKQKINLSLHNVTDFKALNKGSILISNHLENSILPRRLNKHLKERGYIDKDKKFYIPKDVEEIKKILINTDIRVNDFTSAISFRGNCLGSIFYKDKDKDKYTIYIEGHHRLLKKYTCEV